MAPDGLRAAAEQALCAATGASGVVRLCVRCGSAAHGQPRLLGSPLAVSMSYAGRHALVAWGPGPLGVDLELVREDVDVEEWTRTEALAKATGLGLVAPVLPDLPVIRLEMPRGYVGHAAGEIAGWRLVPAPPDGPDGTDFRPAASDL